MPIVNGYATVGEAQAWLSAPAGDTQVLERAIETASRAIDDLCGRRFYRDTGTSARVYGAGHISFDRRTLWVDDIATTSGLAVATDEDDDGTFETSWPTAAWETRPVNGVVGGRSGWPVTALVAVDRSWPSVRYRSPVRVTAQWGWPEVPTEVRQACLIAVTDLFKLREAPFGVAGFGDYGVLRVRENPEVRRLLRPFVRTVGIG
jgi:hypothetical protein